MYNSLKKERLYNVTTLKTLYKRSNLAQCNANYIKQLVKELTSSYYTY